MKKFGVILLIIVMTFSLSGCGQKVKIEGSGIMAVAKGVGKDTIKLKISGTFPTYDEIEVSYLTKEEAEKLQGEYEEALKEADELAEELAEYEKQKELEEAEALKEQESSNEDATNTEEPLEENGDGEETTITENNADTEETTVTEDSNDAEVVDLTSDEEEDTTETPDISTEEIIENYDADKIAENNTITYVQVFEVETLKEKDNLLKYAISAVNSGIASVKITFKLNGIKQTSVQCNMVVDEDLTISSCEILLSEKPDVEVFDDIMYADGTETNVITLKVVDNGSLWKTFSFDESIVSVVGPNHMMLEVADASVDTGEEDESTEVVTEGDGYLYWTVTGVGEGDTVVALASGEEGIKLLVGINVQYLKIEKENDDTEGTVEDSDTVEGVYNEDIEDTENTEGTEETVEDDGYIYSVTITSFDKVDYVECLSSEEIEESNTTKVKKDAKEEPFLDEDGNPIEDIEYYYVDEPIIENLYIPTNAYITQSVAFAYKGEDDDTANTIEMMAEMDDVEMYYFVTKAATRDEYINTCVLGDGVTVTASTTFEFAGKEIKYYFYGSGFACWEEDGVTSALYILDGDSNDPMGTLEKHKEMVEKFLS